MENGKYKKGDIINFLIDDDSIKTSSKEKKIKKGYYEVIKTRESFSVKKEYVYELKSTKKNSKYIYIYFTKFVDKHSI